MAKNDTYGPVMICREKSAKEREEADTGRGGEVASSDLGREESGRMFHLESSETEMEPSWQVFLLLLLSFCMKDSCEMIANLCKKQSAAHS